MPRTKTNQTDLHCSQPNSIFVGIDNGVSGSMGTISSRVMCQYKVPTFSQQDYVKKKSNVTRIDAVKLRTLLENIGHERIRMCLLERPMVNPTRFTATKSALRALEATLIVLEDLKIPYAFIDSKEWQSVLLPKGIKGASELKKASKDIGCRLFPSCQEAILKQRDADGILIAEYCRRIYS